jgi:hypothetical protein
MYRRRLVTASVMDIRRAATTRIPSDPEGTSICSSTSDKCGKKAYTLDFHKAQMIRI